VPNEGGLSLGVGCECAVGGDVAEDLLDHGQHARVFDGVVGMPAFAPGRHDPGQPQLGQAAWPTEGKYFSTADDGFLELNYHGNDPCGALNSCNLTVTNSLGSSVTVTLGPATY
jgi:hypothetical protein